MKKQILLLTGLLMLSIAAIAQNEMNLVVFSEDGDLFYAYINGVRQNDSPQPNVKITGLTSPNLSLRIEFNDKALPQLKQNMALEMGYEHTAKIKRDMKKQLKLRYFGQTPLGSGSSGLNTVAYHNTENPVYNVAPEGSTESSTGGSTVTTTQITGYSTAPSVNISMNGVGVNMNVSGMDPNSGNMTTVTSTTVTSSSSSSSASGQNNSHGGARHKKYPDPVSTDCRITMSAADFSNLKKSVESKPFSDTKMSTARVATKNACLSSAQISEICRLFNMDDDKLAYAKFAFDYCGDKANFYKVGEVFSFSSTNDELNKFLEEK